MATTKLALLHDDSGGEAAPFRALAGGHQAMGRTPGEALDALAAQLPAAESDTLIIVRSLRADRFFADPQRERLETLMARWRGERDAGRGLPPAEQSELERLIEAEIEASGRRAESLGRDLGP